MLLLKLKTLLHQEPVSPYEKKQGKCQIARMTRELQHCRKLTQLRDKYGTLQSYPIKVAWVLNDHWSGIMKEGPKTVEEGIAFLGSLPLPRSLRNCPLCSSAAFHTSSSRRRLKK